MASFSNFADVVCNVFVFVRMKSLVQLRCGERWRKKPAGGYTLHTSSLMPCCTLRMWFREEIDMEELCRGVGMIFLCVPPLNCDSIFCVTTVLWFVHVVTIVITSDALMRCV